MPIRLFLLSFSLSFFSVHSGAQNLFKWLNGATDTSYIGDYSTRLTLRALAGTKFTKYRFGQGAGDKLKYETNDRYNVGVGFNYRFVGLNLAFTMPFVEKNEAHYGHTKFFDFQTFLYLRKLVIDLYYQDYHGYYLHNKDVIATVLPENDFPKRGDIHTTHIGMDAEYIFNNTRFSYRASFVQNEVQKKSAGSVVLGAGIHYLRAKADSSFIPSNITFHDFYNNQPFDKTGYFALGMNIGYAYTLVAKEHFFATVAALGTVGINYGYITDDGTAYHNGGLAPQLGGIFRLAGGYNTEKYYAGIQFVTFVSRNYMPYRNTWQQYQSGNVRLTFAKRIKLKGKMKKEVRQIENQIKNELDMN